MRSVRVHPVDKSLVSLKRQFDAWREGKGSLREKIPEDLWTAAIELVREFGRASLSRVATTLQLRHGSLTAKYEKSCTETSLLSEDTPCEPLIQPGEAVASEEKRMPVIVSERHSAIGPFPRKKRANVAICRRKRATAPIQITRFDFNSEGSLLPPLPSSQLSTCPPPAQAVMPSLDLAGKTESRNHTRPSDIADTFHVKLSFRGLDLALEEAVSLHDVTGIFIEISSKISTLVVQ